MRRWPAPLDRVERIVERPRRHGHRPKLTRAFGEVPDRVGAFAVKGETDRAVTRLDLVEHRLKVSTPIPQRLDLVGHRGDERIKLRPRIEHPLYLRRRQLICVGIQAGILHELPYGGEVVGLSFGGHSEPQHAEQKGGSLIHIQTRDMGVTRLPQIESYSSTPKRIDPRTRCMLLSLRSTEANFNSRSGERRFVTIAPMPGTS